MEVDSNSITRQLRKMQTQTQTQTQRPTVIDFVDERRRRQLHNADKVYDSINRDDKAAFKECINENELSRTLDYLDCSLEELLSECKKNDKLHKLLSMKLSKNATRQGSLDEKLQLKCCGDVGKTCDINVIDLNNNAYRPIKNTSRVVSKEEMKRENIKKSDCLKSFDAQITGKISGWITAKVAIGTGGHQDNVSEELHTMGDWWCKNRHDSNEYLVILLDTDLQRCFDELFNKYKEVENILVCSHVGFQEWLVNTHHKDDIA